MRLLLALLVAVPIAFSGNALTAQDYWEFEPLENEWEFHEPLQGLETEYEEGYYDRYDTEVESEQYEYEPGEGYHEQEWYDPSDWFEIGRDFDYEDDDYVGGYYGDGYYDDDWYYDYYSY